MGRYTVIGSGPDCKSVPSGSVGSSPTLPTLFALSMLSEGLHEVDGASLLRKCAVRYRRFESFHKCLRVL